MTLFDARMRRRRPGLRLKLLMLIELKIQLTRFVDHPSRFVNKMTALGVVV